MTDSFNEWRTEVASNILYRWACDRITTREAKKQCLRFAGFNIDFRQPQMAYMEAFDADTGDYFAIYF